MKRVRERKREMKVISDAESGNRRRGEQGGGDSIFKESLLKMLEENSSTPAGLDVPGFSDTSKDLCEGGGWGGERSLQHLP